MFDIKRQLTNTRPAKSSNPSITTSPTKGTLRLSHAASSLLDIKNGDYVSVIEADAGNGDAFWVVKGIEGEDGQPNFGSKVAGSNGKSSGTLQFSSSNSYNFLKGNSETTTEWLMSEEAMEHEGNKYFLLTEGKTLPKVVKGAATKEEDNEDVDSENEEA